MTSAREIADLVKAVNTPPHWVGVVDWSHSGILVALRKLLSYGWVQRRPVIRVKRCDPAWLWRITPLGREAISAFWEEEERLGY